MDKKKCLLHPPYLRFGRLLAGKPEHKFRLDQLHTHVHSVCYHKEAVSLWTKTKKQVAVPYFFEP